MGPAFASHPTLSHVQFKSDVTSAFEQPVTEIVFFTANSPEKKSLELFAEIAKFREGLATYGALEESQNVVVYAGGWQSVEERTEGPHSRAYNSLLQSCLRWEKLI